MSESAAFCQIVIRASSLVVFYVLKDLKERERGAAHLQYVKLELCTCCLHAYSDLTLIWKLIFRKPERKNQKTNEETNDWDCSY